MRRATCVSGTYTWHDEDVDSVMPARVKVCTQVGQTPAPASQKDRFSCTQRFIKPIGWSGTAKGSADSNMSTGETAPEGALPPSPSVGVTTVRGREQYLVWCWQNQQCFVEFDFRRANRGSAAVATAATSASTSAQSSRLRQRRLLLEVVGLAKIAKT
eukprot:1444887-Pleurochrysis_carterae.AAC.3